MKGLSSYNKVGAYQNIIRWLPLKEGYKKELLVYDFDPNSNTSFSKVQILEVKSENFQTDNSGIRPVFKVTEIYKDSKTVHFIDKVDRRIWKHEFNDGKLIILYDE